MLILGINSAYHEPSACLTNEEVIIAAVEEERFNRVRHGKPAMIDNPHVLPEESIRFCLKQAGVTGKDLDYIGFSFFPDRRLKYNIRVDELADTGDWGSHKGEKLFHSLLLTIPSRLSKFLGTDISSKFKWIPHHMCHSSSSYFCTQFDEAAILSIDGIGEFESTILAYGKNNQIRKLKEFRYPNSIGFLWTKTSRYLGFGEYGQWKVMSLGAYGDPERYYRQWRKLVLYDSKGSYKIDKKLLQFRVNEYSGFEKLFGPARKPNAEIEKRHYDIAAALQKATNEILLSLASDLHKRTGSFRLCQAGGVALNCVSNTYLLENSPFKEFFVQPAANDAGTAIGACYYILYNMLNKERKYFTFDPSLGPEYSSDQIRSILIKEKIPFVEVENIEEVAARLIENGEIISWFHERMEFGPRALGNRSILADPRRSKSSRYISKEIKHREYFRPFACSVLEKQAINWFGIPDQMKVISDRFMLYAYKVKNVIVGKIPAVVHMDQTCRIQVVDKKTNPKFYRLITEYEKLTKVPLILNTSFNENEPISCTPRDAITTCRRAGIKYLIIGNFIAKVTKLTKKCGVKVLPDYIQGLYSPMEKLVNQAKYRVDLSKNPKKFLAGLNKEEQKTLKSLNSEITRYLDQARSELIINPDTTKISQYIISRR